MRVTNFIQKRLLAPYWFTIKRGCIAALTAGLTVCISNAASADPSQAPLFLSNPVVPLAMLNMTKDHQLYMKLYDDYSDLDNAVDADGNKALEITFKSSYSYYGYFDNKKCYVYANSRFEPSKLADATNICNGDSWSGNFLNWATMTRMDAVRKILYGGYRSTDGTTTVLERAFLPHDAHSFAKYYNGNDLPRLIPTAVLNNAPIGLSNTSATGITICNTTHVAAGLSQNVNTTNNPPLLRIAKGNYELWASNETWQCAWNEEKNVSNSNVANTSQIYAYTTNPRKDNLNANDTSGKKLGDGDYNVRVQVCKGDPDDANNSALLESNCKKYSTGYVKPTGLLHKYGEVQPNTTTAKIKFGLITGSFSKNKSGGVLRKNISDMSDEINSTTGVFSSATTGIVATLNKLRIHGYSYDSGGYTGTAAGEDNCNFGLRNFANGQCTNWGNPQSEMYLQALRYFAGKTGADDFYAVDNTSATGIQDLPIIAPAQSSNRTDNTKWIDPLSSDNYCSPLNIIQFNASVTSYDNDDLGAFSQFTTDTLSSWVDKIGDSTHENLYNKDYFVGSNTAPAADEVNLCTAKTLTSLASVHGTCPDAPHLRGTYNIAGLAYFARTTDLRSSLTDRQVVRTYGVELSPAIPSVKIPVPSLTNRFIQIFPACVNHGTNGNNSEGNCGLVAFKVVSQTSTATKNSGVLYVNWEAAEQGGDFDQDMWGVIKYEVTSNNVKVTTDVLAQSSGRRLGFGYVLSGTANSDGFHVWSGTNGFNFPTVDTTNTRYKGEENVPNECQNCADGDAEVSKNYAIGTTASNTTASFLPTPLYYAAKWGGYSKDFETAAQDAAAAAHVTYDDAYLTSRIKTRATDDTYFYATDPYTLQDSLDRTFSNVANDTGSAASVATNSARLSEGQYVYQAQFKSGSWDGNIKGYRFDASGHIDLTSPLVSSVPTSRKVYMKSSTGGLTNFNWTNFDPYKALLKKSTETDYTNAEKRLNWILGSSTDEYSLANTSGILRSRTFTVTENSQTTTVRNLFGDMVNSSPAYVGAFDYRYNNLTDGGSTYAAYVTAKRAKRPRLFIGGNDGMLHAFNASTLVEEFAYVASTTYSKLINLSGLDYGKSSNPHQYLVDGPVIAGDAYFKGADESDKSWHSVVVGTMGAGGKGIFALDVTDVDNPKLLWELTSADLPDMGFIMGKPFLMPLRNGRWGVVVGNGDRGSSSTLTSKLLVIDLLAPLTRTKVIDTGAGTGLSAPAVLVNVKGEAITAFAGDLQGNLFKFNLNDATENNWSASLMFRARDSGSRVQAITAAPTIGINDKLDGIFMVYFGTGKYYDDGDQTASATPQHSFYAIPDTGSVITRADLLAKDYSGTYRAVTTDNPDWTTKKGWYLDFDTDAGERVTTKALLIQDKLIFPTLIPTSNSCQYGGTSWLMEITAVGDKFIGNHVLQRNVNNNYLILGNVSYGVIGSTADTLTTSILSSASNAQLIQQDTQEDNTVYKRQSWRQLR